MSSKGSGTLSTCLFIFAELLQRVVQVQVIPLYNTSYLRYAFGAVGYATENVNIYTFEDVGNVIQASAQFVVANGGFVNPQNVPFGVDPYGNYPSWGLLTVSKVGGGEVAPTLSLLNGSERISPNTLVTVQGLGTDMTLSSAPPTNYVENVLAIMSFILTGINCPPVYMNFGFSNNAFPGFILKNVKKGDSLVLNGLFSDNFISPAQPFLPNQVKAVVAGFLGFLWSQDGDYIGEIGLTGNLQALNT